MKNTKKTIKHHKFNGKKYYIEFNDFKTTYGLQSDGATFLMIQDGVDIKAIDSLIHEAMHAMGIPDEYVHKDNGTTNTMDIAKFIQRWIKQNIELLNLIYGRKHNE